MKIFSLILMICLMTSYSNLIINPDRVEAAAKIETPEYINGQKNTCKYNPSVDGPIPSEVKPCGKTGHKFNSKFYHQEWAVYSASNGNTPVSNSGQMRFIVYGDHTSIRDNVQSFTKGWQPGDYNTVRTNEGHFYGKDNKTDTWAWGEYRFFGYTQDGSLYSNNWLVRDESTNTKLADKHWIYQPWDNLPPSYIYKPASAGYVYMDRNNQPENVMLDKFNNIRKNIERALDFDIYKGVSYANKYEVLPREEAYNDPRNYFAVEQNPTTKEPGVGRMFHFSWDTDSVWYQSFPMEQLEPGEKLPSPAACKVESINGDPIPLGKERVVKVPVKITGTLDDALKIGNLQAETLFYTRKDIAFWHLSAIDQNNQELKLSSSNQNSGIVQKDNTASGVITLTIDTDKLNKSDPDVWIMPYDMSAKATVYYNNHTQSNPSKMDGSCNFNLKFKPTNGPMLSDFGVREQINFETKSSFAASLVGYQDMSYGKDVDQYTFEIKNIDDGTKAAKTFDPAIPEVKAPAAGYLDQNAVQTFLHQFMASKFPSETTEEMLGKTFQITQTIIDKDQSNNNSSTAIRTVVIIQGPPIVAGCETLTPENDIYPAPPQYITPNVDFSFDWYDVVPMPATEKAPDYIPHKPCDDPVDFESFTKTVSVNGTEIDADAFFKGEYIFGEEQIGLVSVLVTYSAPDGSESIFKRHVVIHETKPRVSIAMEGPFKENRTMHAYDRSKESNDQWTEKMAPLSITSFSFVNASNPNLKCRTGYCESNLSEKMFMYKSPGSYQISIAAKRVIVHNGKTYTRYSDPFVVDYQILEDHSPAIIAHAYGDQISRLEQLQLNYQVESIDGDYIAEKKLQVFFDSKNKGVFDTKVFESTGDLTELPKMDKIGQYQIVVEAKEGTNEERLMEFITAADDKRETSKTYFFIDNYAPASDLYIDVPTEKPDMDVFFLLDKALKQESTDYIRNHKVSLTNSFTVSNILSNIGIWDMKTYTYDKQASTSKKTGSTFPSKTITHTTDDGYTGTLTRTSYTNFPYELDEGEYQEKTDEKTATDTCTNDVVTYYDENGNFKDQSSTSVCPGSKSYDDGRFKGTLSRTGQNPSGSCPNSGGTPAGSCKNTWTAYYSGKVYWTRDVWVPNMVEHDNYFGYYAGTVYKDIRQPYDASFMRAVPSKYVVYISDGKASELADLQNVMNKHTAKLVLVGSSDIAGQIAHEKYVPNNKPIAQVVDDVIAYIAESNPEFPKVLKLPGEPIETVTAQFDFENDPMPAATDVLQITQDPKHYDNSMGYDTFAGKPLISEKLGTNWSPFQSIVTFTKPGKYTFYRKIKDKPPTDPNYTGFDYYSNESKIEVFVHRKPIADVTLDFDYLTASNTYKTTWVDMSYDLDHNITRAATDRGIQDRTIKFTSQETGEVFTKIPSELPPGTYVLDYAAQDIEGVWSNPIKRTFVLPNTVPVQFKSKLRTAYGGFSLDSVPASEDLVAHDLWTRYPYSVTLGFKMGSHITRNVPYYSGVKSGNDITWNNEQLAIPATTPDGSYTFTITATGSVGGSKETHTYTVRVVTPIHLTGQIDSATDGTTNVGALVVKDSYSLKATTTKYPGTTTVTAFKGTSYQKTIALASSVASTTGYGQKNWTGSLTVGTMPSGTYTFEWRSATPNGNVETVIKTVQIVNNRPPTADFDWSPKPVYEGDLVQFRSLVNDTDGDSLAATYEMTSPRGTKSSYAYSFMSPYSNAAPNIRMTEVGVWSVKLTVSDGKAAPVAVTKSVNVLPLRLIGAVKHTELWDEHRRSYNEKESGNSESPRGYRVFWAGEKFILEAASTETGTATQAVRVEVKMGSYSVRLSSLNGSRSSWQGELWDAAFADLPDGPLTFTFTAYYNNGTIKVYSVDVVIQGETLEIAGVHRVQ